jgi:hypothetical protein
VPLHPLCGRRPSPHYRIAGRCSHSSFLFVGAATRLSMLRTSGNRHVIWQRCGKERRGNGYQISSVYLAQSGQPVTIQSEVDSNGNGDSAGDRAIFNPAGTTQVSGDVFPVCEGTGGVTYIGSTSFLNASNNGCNANSTTLSGGDPAIGYTPVNSSDRYVIAASRSKSNIGRNSFRSPGFGVLNLSVFKNTYFTESKYLQLRAEVFNVRTTL